MLETFPTITPKDIPRTNSTKIERISPALFLDYSQQIMDTFTIDGYMLEAKLQLVPSNSKGNLMKIVLKAPANLWSLQVLKYRGDQPRNDFEIKVLDALARRCNLSMELISTELVNQIDILHIVKFV